MPRRLSQAVLIEVGIALLFFVAMLLPGNAIFRESLGAALGGAALLAICILTGANTVVLQKTERSRTVLMLLALVLNLPAATMISAVFPLTSAGAVGSFLLVLTSASVIEFGTIAVLRRSMPAHRWSSIIAALLMAAFMAFLIRMSVTP